MVRKVAIAHTDFRLYWPSRLSALHRCLGESGIELSVIEISGKGSPYSFDTSERRAGPQWRQLFEDRPIEDIGPGEAFAAVLKRLEEIQPDLVLSGAIAFPSGAAAVHWGIARKRPVVVFDNARIEDVPRSRLVDWVKRQVYSHVDAMVIPAPSHRASFEYFGFAPPQLFFGINCIDNAFFSRPEPCERPAVPGMSDGERYFLAVGRQVEKKNWSLLLDAFRAVADNPALGGWHLLFIGDGPDREKLVSGAGELAGRRVHFLPFKNQQELVGYYRNAGALVLPSVYGETWGLVVNEAMAAGLPVLVSKKCGCSETLVHDGINGYLLDPDERASIESALVRCAAFDPEKRAAMGEASRQIISEWGLERFCGGVLDAISYAESRDKRNGSLAGKIVSSFWKGRYRPT